MAEMTAGRCADVLFYQPNGARYDCALGAGHEGPHQSGAMSWTGTRNLAASRPADTDRGE